MAKLIWDATGEHIYETGVDRGVIYPRLTDGTGGYGDGEVWNGLTAVTESPSGAEATPIYADNIKYLNLVSAEDFGCTIEAYTYPAAFEACDGTRQIRPGVTIAQQDRNTFGFSYRTIVGNDVELNAYGHKIHLLYGCLAAPSEKARTTVNDSPEATNFSWDISTTPVPVPDHKPTAHIVIDSTDPGVTPAILASVEDALYGTTSDPAKLLMPEDVLALIPAG